VRLSVFFLENSRKQPDTKVLKLDVATVHVLEIFCLEGKWYLATFLSGQSMLGLHSALSLLKSLERLNKALQGSDVNVSSMLQSVQMVKSELKHLRFAK